MATAGDPGVSGLDPATSELRRLLAKGLPDDAARAFALNALLGCRVLVATWPNSPEALRTLTNSDGEQAMPMFSSRHELLSAARRFAWSNADGSMSSRELDARDVLKSALAQGTHFVVLDLCAEHVVEFERDEIEAALASPRASKPGRRPTPHSRRPVKLAQVPITPSKRPAALGEIDAPFDGERASLMAIEDVVVKPRGGARLDPRVEPSRPPLREARVSTPPKNPRSFNAPPKNPRPVADNPRNTANKKRTRHRAPAEPLDTLAAASAAATQPLPAPTSAAAADALSLSEVDTRPLRPERGLSTRSVAPPPAPEPAPTPPPEPAQVLTIEASKPRPATEPAPLRQDAAPSLPDLPSLENLPSQQAVAESKPQEAADSQPLALAAAAEMLVPKTNLSGQAWPQVVPAASSERRKDAGTKAEQPEGRAAGAMSAARALAGRLMGGDPKRPKPVEAANARVEPSPKPVAEQAAAEYAGEPGDLRPLETRLEDALLDQIAETLRKYPEVQWACEVSDGSALPVIGMRVEPTFLMRVDEIKAAVASVGDSHNTALSVLLLIDPQQMRDARAQGSAFFPWRKRAARPNAARS